MKRTDVKEGNKSIEQEQPPSSKPAVNVTRNTNNDNQNQGRSMTMTTIIIVVMCTLASFLHGAASGIGDMETSLSSDENYGRKNIAREDCSVLDDGSSVCMSTDGLDERDYMESHSTADEAGTRKEEEEHTDPSCEDEHEMCAMWASIGECKANPKYMLISCQKSCNSCARNILSKINQKEIEKTTRFGEEQVAQGKERTITLSVIQKSVSYMEDLFNAEPSEKLPKDILDSCLNRDSKCSFWAAIGECEANPAYMVTKCAPSCLSCHMIDLRTRCPPLDESNIPGLRPGELDSMFERIIETANDESTNYSVTVHSRPRKKTQKGILQIDESDILEGPWVITFDDFLSHKECEHLIKLGYEVSKGYERSKDVGPLSFDGSFESVESATRTSENAWCTVKDNCRNDPTAHSIMERISSVTGIPSENYEDFQILRYEVGQFYRSHHDYIDIQKNRRCGPRILTFFLYLSDVDAGGGTAFPDLNNLTVTPKKGRALLWPSVLNSDPSKKDGRTQHEALTVWGGLKFAANAWIHLYDYVQPQLDGCT